VRPRRHLPLAQLVPARAATLSPLRERRLLPMLALVHLLSRRRLPQVTKADIRETMVTTSTTVVTTPSETTSTRVMTATTTTASSSSSRRDKVSVSRISPTSTGGKLIQIGAA
ncbi:hypothetical protein F441_16692, partial [Phytophthora nicotianae CJ01A1]